MMCLQLWSLVLSDISICKSRTYKHIYVVIADAIKDHQDVPMFTQDILCEIPPPLNKLTSNPSLRALANVEWLQKKAPGELHVRMGKPSQGHRT